MIPAHIYNDAELFELEKRRLFSRAWLFVAHESEIPQDGDYVVRRVLNDSFIIARDSNGNVFPLNGQVSLRARIGAADESADYIISSNRTFVNGQLDAMVQVTKRGFSAYIIVDSGVVGESPSFQVNAGPCEKILMTFPGETWVNGLNDPDFSGNLGVPNAVTAGDVIDAVTLRPSTVTTTWRRATATSP